MDSWPLTVALVSSMPVSSMQKTIPDLAAQMYQRRSSDGPVAYFHDQDGSQLILEDC